MNSLFIVWSDTLKLSIPILDEQYRGLACIINSFAYMHTHSKSEASLLMFTTADMFYNAAGVNFFTLERLMFESNYPHLAAYEDLHRKLRVALKQVVNKCRMEWESAQLLDFLKSYWHEFVLVRDRPYARYLRAHYENSCLMQQKAAEEPMRQIIMPEERFAISLEKMFDTDQEVQHRYA